MKANRWNANFFKNRPDEDFATLPDTKQKFGISDAKFTCEPVTCIGNWTLNTAADWQKFIIQKNTDNTQMKILLEIDIAFAVEGPGKDSITLR